MKTYRVDIEFTHPAYVIAESEEDAIAAAFDRLIGAELYEADITTADEMPDDENYIDNYEEYEDYEDDEWIE